MSERFLMEQCPEPPRDEPEERADIDESLSEQVDRDQRMWARFDRLIAEAGALVKRV